MSLLAEMTTGDAAAAGGGPGAGGAGAVGASVDPAAGGAEAVGASLNSGGGAGGSVGADAGFVLQEGAVLPGKIRGRKTLEERARDYGVSDRTAKRWQSLGRKANDLPPWDEPARMAAWYRRISALLKEGGRVPGSLLELEGKDGGAAAGGGAGASSPPADSAGGASGDPPAAGKVVEKIAAIDLAGLVLENDEEVRQAKAIVLANYMRVESASAKGDSDGVRRWQPLWKDSVEQLRKIEKATREKYEAERRVIDRRETENEIAQLLEALRLARMVMPKKIRDVMDGLAEGKRRRRVLRLLGAMLEDAVSRVREKEDDLLRNIGAFKSAEEFVSALEAAA